MKFSLKETKYYRLVNNDLVCITKINETPWGIHGEYITGNRSGEMELWNDEEYPYKMSWDTDEQGYSLTETEVTKEDYPEMFL